VPFPGPKWRYTYSSRQIIPMTDLTVTFISLFFTIIAIGKGTGGIKTLSSAINVFSMVVSFVTFVLLLTSYLTCNSGAMPWAPCVVQPYYSCGYGVTNTTLNGTCFTCFGAAANMTAGNVTDIRTTVDSGIVVFFSFSGLSVLITILVLWLQTQLGKARDLFFRTHVSPDRRLAKVLKRIQRATALYVLLFLLQFVLAAIFWVEAVAKPGVTGWAMSFVDFNWVTLGVYMGMRVISVSAGMWAIGDPVSRFRHTLWRMVAGIIFAVDILMLLWVLMQLVLCFEASGYGLCYWTGEGSTTYSVSTAYWWLFGVTWFILLFDITNIMGARMFLNLRKQITLQPANQVVKFSKGDASDIAGQVASAASIGNRIDMNMKKMM